MQVLSQGTYHKRVIIQLVFTFYLLKAIYFLLVHNYVVKLKHNCRDYVIKENNFDSIEHYMKHCEFYIMNFSKYDSLVCITML